MQWACFRDATGRDYNWVMTCSVGHIVPGQAWSWGGVSTKAKADVCGGVKSNTIWGPGTHEVDSKEMHKEQCSLLQGGFISCWYKMINPLLLHWR
jgi:hypothetical protein